MKDTALVPCRLCNEGIAEGPDRKAVARLLFCATDSGRKLSLEIVLIALILATDQAVKFLAENRWAVGESKALIPGLVRITCVHNYGAALGMLPGFRWLLLAVTVLIVGILAYILIRCRRKLSLLSRIILALLLAGALGNAVDRIMFGYVRDMIDVYIVHFPVFNVADFSLVIGCVLLFIDAVLIRKNSMIHVLEANLDRRACMDLSRETEVFGTVTIITQKATHTEPAGHGTEG